MRVETIQSEDVALHLGNGILFEKIKLLDFVKLVIWRRNKWENPNYSLQ